MPAKPAYEYRRSRIVARAWKNQGADGVWYSTTVVREYAADNGATRTAVSFGRDDLPVVALCCRKVHEWILSQTAQAKETPDGPTG